nr:MAG TPA: Protein of unknown function (DUF3800) [Caudoviricetes sp.]
MNSNWRNRPTSIDYVPREIDYIISVDESGNSSLEQVLRAKRGGSAVAQSEKHFTITACSIAMSDLEHCRDMVMELKNKYWKHALYNYAGTVKRICLHSREIRGRKEAFSPSIIDYNGFIADLSQLISDAPIKLYASHIDKERHVKQYAFPLSPYDLCMNFVLERIMYDIPNDKTCIIIIEARGKKEDKALLDFIKSIIDNGSSYDSSSTFKRIKGVYFNPKWCESANSLKSYWELELADLCAYPIQKFFVYGTKDKAFETLLPKISCYPNYIGKGLKSFP